MQQLIKIGTRGSPLAMAQAHEVRDRLCAAHGLLKDNIEIRVFKTSGDIILDTPLVEAGGKGLFTKEIEDALLAGDVDIAVHSSKDMPTMLPPGLVLQAFLPREATEDVFISKDGASLMDLPEGAVVGTSSLRRRALALSVRPDLTIVGFRGNVQTRLKKLAEGVASGTFLALAGLNRLGFSDPRVSVLSAADFPPAPAQGAIGLEIREGDERASALIAPLHCPATGIAVTAERHFLAALDGSCRTPIAARSHLEGDHFEIEGRIYSIDGQICFQDLIEGPADQANVLARSLGERLKAKAGPDFFAQLVKDTAALL